MEDLVQMVIHRMNFPYFSLEEAGEAADHWTFINLGNPTLAEADANRGWDDLFDIYYPL